MVELPNRKFAIFRLVNIGLLLAASLDAQGTVYQELINLLELDKNHRKILSGDQ